jgi:hypothetical protein
MTFKLKFVATPYLDTSVRRIRYGEMLENTVKNTFKSESRCSGVVTISL